MEDQAQTIAAVWFSMIMFAVGIWVGDCRAVRPIVLTVIVAVSLALYTARVLL